MRFRQRTENPTQGAPTGTPGTIVNNMAKKQTFQAPHQGSLVLAAAIAIGSFLIPVLHWVTVPLQYLNTHLHELCHALAGTLSGGSVSDIAVFRDGSGVTHILRGSMFLIAPAGYCGSAIIGALMIAFARTPKAARNVLRVLGGILAISVAFWVRGDFFGIVSGIFWVFALLLGAQKLQERHTVFVVQFLGATQCLASLQAFLTLVNISVQVRGIDSDATNMAAVTGIPPILWALTWFVFSVVLMALTLRWAWKTRPS